MRKITKLRRSVKAISPVISVLLMIAIAVVASLVAYAWVMGMIGTNTAKAGKAIQIQSIHVASGTVDYVYVQNVGQGDVTFDPLGSVYINDVLQTLGVGDFIPNPLKPGQTTQIHTAYTLLDDSAPKVKVVTKDGIFAQTTGKQTSSSGGTGPTPPTSYSIDFVMGSGGQLIDPAQGSHDVSGTIAISATAAPGNHFTYWTSTGSITFADANSASTTATISSAGSITANFAENAPITDTRSPSANSGTWSNEQNAYADEGSSASSDANNEQSTFSGYGFTVPSDATNIQVRVRLDAWVQSGGNDNLRLEVNDGSWHTYTPEIDLPTSQTTIWCDVTSLSTGGWTPSEVNSIQVRVTHVQVGSMWWDNDDIYLDWIPIEVTYTP